MKAGTRYTPSLSGTVSASGWTSADDLMMPSPSRSQETTAPPTNTLPSSAYSSSPAELPGDRREQIVARFDGAVGRVHEHEAAGAVGVLGHAAREAGLAEQGRLLIAGDAGDLDSVRARLSPLTSP